MRLASNGAGIVALTLAACIAMPQMASAEILAGWYDFNDGITGDPTFYLESKHLPTTGPGALPDILAADVAAEAWGGSSFRARNGSNDNTFGTLPGAGRTTNIVIRGKGGDGVDGGPDTLTFAITNNRPEFNVVLTGFHFDFGGTDGYNPITAIDVKYNDGTTTTTINRFTSIVTQRTTSLYDYPDFDTTGLNLTLAPGATGTFTIVALNGGTGEDQHYDNIAIVGTLAPIPEPGTLALLGMTLLGLGWYAWRKRRVTG